MTDAVFLLIGGGNEYAQLLRPLGDVIHIPGIPKKEQLYLVNEVDCVVFTGGADVDPKWYGETKHTRTSSHPARDEPEAMFYKAAVKDAVPCVGICRGSQFLTVMNGGRLYQHVTGHQSGSHMLQVYDPLEGEKGGVKTMTCSSTHHQMMNPFDLPEDEFVVCGWSFGKMSHGYESMRNKTVTLEPSPPKEPEVVFFPYTECLAVQGHPEFSDKSLDAYRGMIRKYINLLANRRLKAEKIGGKDSLDRDKLHNVSKYGSVRAIN